MAIYYPFMGGGATCNQVATPLVYDESLSIAQQIACLHGKIRNIGSGSLSVDDFREFVNRLNIELDKLEKEAEAYADGEIDKVLKILEQVQIGMLVWDVVIGAYANGVESMRDLFNDVAVHAITVDSLANLDMTVDGLSECGLNVRGLAVFSGYLVGEDFVPEGIGHGGDAPIDSKSACAVLANGEVRNGYFVEGG